MKFVNKNFKIYLLLFLVHLLIYFIFKPKVVPVLCSKITEYNFIFDLTISVDR